jgi:uroporphyrinogen-III synthase
VCSPSAVASIASTVGNDTLLVCLGDTTASAARALGLHVDGVAARPTMRALVDAIEAAFGARV